MRKTAAGAAGPMQRILPVAAICLAVVAIW